MARSAKPRRIGKTLAVPFLFSLAVHGLLFLLLGLWPARTPGPTLSIESTRITVDTCFIDAERPRDQAGDPREPNRATDIAPILLEAPVAPQTASVSAGPTLSAVEPVRPRTMPAGPSGGDGSGTTGSLFPLPTTAASVVYVLDCSMSMGMDDKMDLACRELLAGLRRLPPSARFQVVAYNTFAEPLVIDGRMDLLPATPALIERAAGMVRQLSASGESDHVRALCRALALHPDVLFFVTDADALSLDQVALITSRNRGTAIHAIELTRRRVPRPDGPLARLARDNRGTYRPVCPPVH